MKNNRKRAIGKPFSPPAGEGPLYTTGIETGDGRYEVVVLLAHPEMIEAQDGTLCPSIRLGVSEAVTLARKILEECERAVEAIVKDGK